MTCYILLIWNGKILQVYYILYILHIIISHTYIFVNISWYIFGTFWDHSWCRRRTGDGHRQGGPERGCNLHEGLATVMWPGALPQFWSIAKVIRAPPLITHFGQISICRFLRYIYQIWYIGLDGPVMILKTHLWTVDFIDCLTFVLFLGNVL